MSRGVAAFGIDVSADAAHVVAVDLAAPPSVVLCELVHPVGRAELVNLLRPAAAVAIDAPGGRSDAPHRGDARLPPKFRLARCGEVALRNAGHAVPWISPGPSEPLPGWMACGLEVWGAAAEAGAEAIVETFPHAVFATLAGTVLRHKQRPDGAAARARVLAPLLRAPAWVQVWSHDGLDALAAALVAWHVTRGSARRLDCSGDSDWPTHDGTSIWLPPDPASSTPARRAGGASPQGPDGAALPRRAHLRLLEGSGGGEHGEAGPAES